MDKEKLIEAIEEYLSSLDLNEEDEKQGPKKVSMKVAIVSTPEKKKDSEDDDELKRALDNILGKVRTVEED